MVGFNRDEVPGSGPLVASDDTDPCSFYTTKLSQFIQEMLRWWMTWKDAVIERDEKKARIPELEAQVEALQKEVDELKNGGGDPSRLADQEKELRERQGDLEETRREWEILNDRLRHYDDAFKKIGADISEMTERLHECVQKQNASGFA
jgi:chromosome segregation ATPase